MARAAEKKAVRERVASVARKTKETDIRIELDLDGSGQYEVATGVPFFDHMLESFARHGLFDLRLSAKGDVDVDLHHTVEDVGIALGQAFRRSARQRRGHPALRQRGSCPWPRAEGRRGPRRLESPLSRLRREALEHPDRRLRREPHRGLRSTRSPRTLVSICTWTLCYGRSPHHAVEAVFKGHRPRAAGRGRDRSPRAGPAHGEGRALGRSAGIMSDGPGPRIALVDYGAGNLRSVAKALERTGLDVRRDGRPAPFAGPTGSCCPASEPSRTPWRACVDAGLVDGREGGHRGRAALPRPVPGASAPLRGGGRARREPGPRPAARASRALPR